MQGIVYYELRRPFETINSQRYRLQLMPLKHAIQEKRSEWRDKHEKNWSTRPNISRRSEMGGLTPPAIFTRHCLFRLSFVSIDAVGTYWRALHLI
ncbi:hypothetical protein Trydic_g13803 [Trypoxylus dichotomus]